MDDEDLHQDINSDILRLTRIKSRQLAGNYGFSAYDAEDIQQDLLLDYLKRARSFNANCSDQRSFARLVIRHGVATLIERRSARRRHARASQTSLDQDRDVYSLNADENGAVHRRVADRLIGGMFEKDVLLQIDIERILIHLPRTLASLCQLLMFCESASEAAAKAGISRATLYRQIHQVRTEFARAGLGERPIGGSMTRSRKCMLAEISGVR